MNRVFPVREALVQPLEPGRLSSLVFEHGTLEVRFYAPDGTDTQTPHTRDEVYVVVGGKGQMVDDAGRRDLNTGDCVFVPAGCTHRFEDFTDDFAVWVVFYGPQGGESSLGESTGG